MTNAITLVGAQKPQGKLPHELRVGQYAQTSEGTMFLRTHVGLTRICDGDTYTFGCGEWAGLLTEHANKSNGPTLRLFPFEGSFIVTTEGQVVPVYQMVEELTCAEKELVRLGRNIPAIKSVRERLGLGFKDAKDLVESYRE